jgi:hypothetical protein
LFLCFSTHHAMHTYGGNGGRAPPFLTSEVGKGELPDSHADCFTPDTRSIRCLPDPRIWTLWTREKSYRSQEQDPDTPVVQTVDRPIHTVVISTNNSRTSHLRLHAFPKTAHKLENRKSSSIIPRDVWGYGPGGQGSDPYLNTLTFNIPQLYCFYYRINRDT